MQKVVFITGASSGIGKAIGEYLHHKNYIVFGTSRNPSTAISSIFPLVKLDVRNSESIKNAIAEVISKTGLEVIFTNDIKKATIIIGLRKYLTQNLKLKKFSQQKNIPIYIVNRPTFYQIVKLLQVIF